MARSVEFRSGPPESLDADAVALALPEGVPADEAALRPFDDWVAGGLSRRVREGGFTGDSDETSFFPGRGGDGPHLVAVGLGPGESVDREAVRAAAGRAIHATRQARLDSLAFVLPPAYPGDGPSAARAAAEGLVLGDWSYDDLRTRRAREERLPRPSRAVVACPPGVRDARGGEEEAVALGSVLAESQNWARGLVARPPNVATPTHLARRARELSEAHQAMEVDVRGRERLQEDGFGAVLAVSRGSAEEPSFITVDYRGSDGEPAVLLGKGVTFDSGGISLKPSKGMEDMKYDMAGAAAVLGCLRAVAALDLPLRVVGLIPAAENLPSGTALKPSDVIRGLSGRSIEVVNTDAEGRLLLSDALEFGRRLDPRCMVDVATLTGGCVVALGRHALGLMANDDALAGSLLEAGRQTGERAWRLPLFEEYRDQLDSDIADIKNSGGREASAITAGCFLREFAGDTPWAHLDIAGTAWSEERRDYQPEGATGVGVRLLTDWLMTEP